MVLGNVNNLDDLKFYPELIQKALSYLRDTDFSKIESGTYELAGKDLFAVVQEITTNSIENRKPETHVEYIDIQFVVSGFEFIGVAGLRKDSIIQEDLHENKDIIFYEKPYGESFLYMLPGNFAIFFPTDIHRPCCKVEEFSVIKKVVMKVKYSAL